MSQSSTSQTVAGTVYFDNAATTSMLPCAIERLNALSTEVMGNASSSHRRGRQALEILDSCHETLGRLFNVPPSHVIFTSGGTESNNLAIWGGLGGLAQVFNWLKADNTGQILTTTIEHSATSTVFETLESLRAQVGWIGVDKEGLLDMADLEKALESRTRLISLHHVQNELGVVQNVAEIARRVRAKQPDALIHIDAIQSFMKIPVNIDDLGIDMISLSSHKIGGPKGIGALILGRRFENRSPKIGALLSGSNQQNGLRPGTVPVPAIGAFVSAVQWGIKHLEENQKHLLKLREHLTSMLPAQTVINGLTDLSVSNPRRAPQTINFSIPGLPSAVTVEALSALGFCISAGSACHSTNPKPNATLMQMGVGRERALSAVRVSFCFQNTTQEVDRFIEALNKVIKEYL